MRRYLTGLFCISSLLVAIWGVLFYRNVLDAAFFAFGVPQGHLRRLALIRWSYILAGLPILGLWLYSSLSLVLTRVGSRHPRQKVSQRRAAL